GLKRLPAEVAVQVAGEFHGALVAVLRFLPHGKQGDPFQLPPERIPLNTSLSTESLNQNQANRNHKEILFMPMARST
ncbi:MAG: hypothetical protein EBV68_02855, partial [Betaproteobacteria bacterium]|nr:hypothetical protein [Betaproteobacteria bacterium]